MTGNKINTALIIWSQNLHNTHRKTRPPQKKGQVYNFKRKNMGKLAAKHINPKFKSPKVLLCFLYQFIYNKIHFIQG